MKNALLTLAFALSLYCASGQQRLLLHSGTVVTTDNTESFIRSGTDGSEIFNGYYYRVLQFATIPTLKEKEIIAASGLILMEYLPENAFITAIPSGYDKNLLKKFNIYSVTKLDPLQKINAKLLGDIPEYSRRVQGYADVTVQYFRNIKQEALPLDESLQLLSVNKDNHVLTVRIEENRIKELATLPWVLYISPAGVPDIPDDTRGRSLHRSNVINSSYESGRHYDGAGVVIGLADDGEVGPHIDFTGRITNHLSGAGGSHGDMTSGICVGAGNLDPVIRGMATGAYLHVYDINGYPHIVDAVNNFSTLGTVITSTSYSQGCNEYTVETQQGDMMIHDNPQLEFVFSAGNNGTGNCQYGAGSGWGNITGGYKQGKNVIACGNLNPFDVLDNTSSRGPASDGRIKPDICANGLDQMSTDGNNTYQVGGGTSAASPGIAGVCAQLYQAYKSMNGGMNPESPLIKACMLNSAEDLGNAGPDFTYGWGRVNAFRALTTLEDGRYLHDSISQGASNLHVINVPANVSELRVMIYWLDPEGTPLAAKSLVNNIDMFVTDPSITIWNPWVLDPTPNAANLSALAVRSVDSLNNMEQVTVPAPAAGPWTVHVDGTSIPGGSQSYYIVYEFRTEDIVVTYPVGGEGFVPGEQEVVRWDAIKGLGAFSLEYSTNNGGSWTNINSNVGQNNLLYAWSVPSVISGEVLVRVSRGASNDVSDTTFAIINEPQNIQVDYSCVDSIRLTWSPVAGAASYNIYMLDSMYMSVVGNSLMTAYTVTGTNPNSEYWFSVSAVTTEGREGRRAYAIHKNPGIVDCPLALDASLTAIVSPANGILTDCQDNDSLSVSVLIENTGINDIYNFDVSYMLNGGAVVTETIVDTIPAGTSMLYSFAGTIDLSVAGSYVVESWLTYSGDLNIYNDSAASNITVVAGALSQLPFTEDFESQSLCGTASDCETTVCSLVNGWINEANGSGDDIDFRVSAGATPSSGTGPDVDHTTGSASGQYIYLEASVCFNKTALLQMPCVDLTTALNPQLRFWYHMSGVDMGELHVDILSEGAWIDDITIPIAGNQGVLWQQRTVDLSAYAGEVVTVRFRAVTGPDYTSDLALDDISIIELNVAPSPAFTANYQTSCPGNTITLNDKSTGNPTTWQWTISPSTFSFVNGTNAASQNPQVQFTNAGTYTVQLTVSNAFGSDSLMILSYINIVLPSSLSLNEDFQGAVWPPAGWRIESAGNTYTWQPAFNIMGSNGSTTNAAMINNFDYVAAGAEDGIARVEVDLGGAVTPVMTFDVAYARASTALNDELRIDISTDCGNSFSSTSYIKSGAVLATTPVIFASAFAPTIAGQWRNDTLSLSSWAGQHVTVKFVNTSASGNNLYIDNINISDLSNVSGSGTGAAVNIYPNPSDNGMFSLDIRGSAGVTDITISDVQGKIIRRESITAENIYEGYIDLRNESKGVYFLELSTSSGKSRHKLTVL